MTAPPPRVTVVPSRSRPAWPWQRPWPSLPGVPASATEAAEAQGSAQAAPSASADSASSLSYVVNVRPGHGPSAHVKRAIAKAGGTIVTSYDRIGVIVVHSSDPDFAKSVPARGVQSAGATRTAPLPSAATTDTGAPKVLSGKEMAAAEAAEGRTPCSPSSGTCPPSRRTRRTRSRWAAAR
ncbi:hypothetical protein LV779_32145 [Streptomyces thinghirensis]|nr:hypothetical protein [Streptomyces thinghirensis]